MISLRSLSISLGPECLLSARAAKQALEKCQGGCGSVAHITGEPLIMSIGTRAPSSSVSSTETKRRGASHVRRALAMRPCLVSELTDITTRSVRGHGAPGWAYSSISRSRGSHATGTLGCLRIRGSNALSMSALNMHANTECGDERVLGYHPCSLDSFFCPCVVAMSTQI